RPRDAIDVLDERRLAAIPSEQGPLVEAEREPPRTVDRRLSVVEKLRDAYLGGRPVERSVELTACQLTVEIVSGTAGGDLCFEQGDIGTHATVLVRERRLHLRLHHPLQRLSRARRQRVD